MELHDKGTDEFMCERCGEAPAEYEAPCSLWICDDCSTWRDW